MCGEVTSKGWLSLLKYRPWTCCYVNHGLLHPPVCFMTLALYLHSFSSGLIWRFNTATWLKFYGQTHFRDTKSPMHPAQLYYGECEICQEDMFQLQDRVFTKGKYLHKSCWSDMMSATTLLQPEPSIQRKTSPTVGTRRLEAKIGNFRHISVLCACTQTAWKRGN